MCLREWFALWLAGLFFIGLSTCVLGVDTLCSNLTRHSDIGDELLQYSRNITIVPRKVLYCCLGYTPIGSTDQFSEVRSEKDCEPFCRPTCPANSTCVPPKICECVSDAEFHQEYFSPSQCMCNPGFTHKSPEQCVPICPDFCTNGVCINKKCVCNEGYRTNGSGLCVPRCVAGCREGEECTSPNVCSSDTVCVNEKYERNDSGNCVPKCTDCSNDKCVCEAAEKCVTVPGYAFNSVASKCEALCDNCEDGLCIAPGVCGCLTGSQLVNGICELCTDSGCSDAGSTPGHSRWIIPVIQVGGVLCLMALIVLVSKCRAKRRKMEGKHAERKRFNNESRDRFRKRVEQHRFGNKLRPPCPLPRPRPKPDSDRDSSHTDEYVEVIEECQERSQKDVEVPISTPEPHYEEILQSNANGMLPSYDLPCDPLAMSQRCSPEHCNSDTLTPPEIPPRSTAKQNDLDLDGYLAPQSRNIYVLSNTLLESAGR